MKKLVITKNDVRLQSLKDLIDKQNRRILILWSLDCADSVLQIFEENYPKDMRPRKAFEAAKAWAFGEIKMPVAKKAALDSHKAASEIAKENLAACAAARAMGHIVGIIHVKTHAMGFVLYALTAFVYPNEKNSDEIIINKCNWLFDRLRYWEENTDKAETTWAPFLIKE